MNCWHIHRKLWVCLQLRDAGATNVNVQPIGLHCSDMACLPLTTLVLCLCTTNPMAPCSRPVVLSAPASCQIWRHDQEVMQAYARSTGSAELYDKVLLTVFACKLSYRRGFS